MTTIKQLIGKKGYLTGKYESHYKAYGILDIIPAFSLKTLTWNILIKKKKQPDDLYQRYQDGKDVSDITKSIGENFLLTNENSTGSKKFNLDFTKYNYPSKKHVTFKFTESLPQILAEKFKEH